ncbi:MAG: Uma2 family endonuclease [Acidimicrobiales bacterium]
MKTVVLGPRPAELESLLERRRFLGLDIFDEVWEGTYHVAPAPHSDHGLLGNELTRVILPLAEAAGLICTDPFNLGEPDNYRVPDHGWLRGRPGSTFVPTAAIVVEVVSPDDETFEKLPFYAAHGVDEVLIAERDVERVSIFTLVGDHYEPTDRSALLNVSAEELAGPVRWP